MIRQYKVNQQVEFEAVLFGGVEPKIADRETGEQKVDDTGEPVYTVHIIVKERESGRNDTLTVTVPGRGGKAPGDGMAWLTPVVLHGFRVGAWSNERTKQSQWYFNADSVARAAEAGK